MSTRRLHEPEAKTKILSYIQDSDKSRYCHCQAKSEDRLLRGHAHRHIQSGQKCHSKRKTRPHHAMQAHGPHLQDKHAYELVDEPHTMHFNPDEVMEEHVHQAEHRGVQPSQQQELPLARVVNNFPFRTQEQPRQQRPYPRQGRDYPGPSHTSVSAHRLHRQPPTCYERGGPTTVTARCPDQHNRFTPLKEQGNILGGRNTEANILIGNIKRY
jgi:hypothetical protein